MFVKMFVRGAGAPDQFGALDVILTIAPGASNKKAVFARAALPPRGSPTRARYRFTFIKSTRAGNR